MKRSKTFLTKAAMLLIVALFSLTGARAQITLPYEYGFENNNLTAAGWTKITQGTSTDSDWWGNPQNNTAECGINAEARQTGSYGFRFSSFYEDTNYNQYLISPELNVSSSWGGTVQFSYRTSSDDTEYGPERFKVGYSTTDTNLSSFTFGDEIQTNSTSWTLYEGTFPAGTKYVAIFYYSNYVYRLYVDDFSFEEGTVVISGNQEFEESTHVTITCDVEGATILYSTDEGTSWNTYQGEFPLTETTTVIAKATKDGLGESPEVSKFFAKSGHFTWNLTTNPSSYTTASQQQVNWVSTGATMTLAKARSSTNANAYLGGTGNRNYTRFYNGQTLTIAPVEGFAVSSIQITSTYTYYAQVLEYFMSLSNASATLSGSTVTITPIDDTQPVVATFSNNNNYEIQVSGVNVEYYTLPAPFIAIASVNGERNESSASAKDRTLNTFYSNNVSNANATAVLCDAEGNTNNVNYNWISVSLTNDENKKLTYTIDPNTTTSARTAYVKVTAGGVSSPVIAIIQAAAYVLADGDGADNNSLIVSHMGEKCSVILDSRTFTAGTTGTPGKWYTLCLPFDVDLNAAGCPLAGADARELDEDNTRTRIEGKTLKLEFTPAEGGILKAGQPYIIRWESGADIVNPAFADVTIVPESNPSICNFVDGKSVYFVGSYAYQSFGAEDKTTIFISSNKFYYVGNGTTIGAQRGYFKLNGFSYDKGTTNTGGVKEFGITFDEEDPTGIDNVNVNLNDNESIYNVAGQRLGKMQKGINIVNGKKIFVK